jgi:dTDP-glucose pyrophosphorylase
MGKTMVEHVVDNVRVLDPHGDVFVADQKAVGRTSGAMQTIQRALVQANPRFDESLIIANCDQLLAIPEHIRASGIGHGVVFTFKSASPSHSYVTTNAAGRITSIVEKPTNPPTEKAVSGVYWFVNRYAIEIAIKDMLALPGGGDEQYLSRAIQHMVDQEYSLYAVDAPTAILGTPEDFQRFETALEVIISQMGQS